MLQVCARSLWTDHAVQIIDHLPCFGFREVGTEIGVALRSVGANQMMSRTHDLATNWSIVGGLGLAGVQSAGCLGDPVKFNGGTGVVTWRWQFRPFAAVQA